MMNTLIMDRDLTRQAPSSPRARVAGFVIASRAVDKCRASLAGTLGEYHYDCPLDHKLFSFKGITGREFEAAVKASTTYDEVGAWLLANGAAKTPAEIKAWSDEMEAFSPLKDPARRAHFVDNCSRLMLNPETNTAFDLLEADDRDSFLRKAVQFMKSSSTPLTESPETPVFPQTPHQSRPTSPASNPPRKSQKRDNIFSKSRDVREDRGERQMKTTRNAQTFPHGR
jgi:hypothetical protein